MEKMMMQASSRETKADPSCSSVSVYIQSSFTPRPAHSLAPHLDSDRVSLDIGRINSFLSLPSYFMILNS